jgi:hypothetical protein
MTNKYFQRIIAFAAVILFALPLSLKAQTTQQFSNEELAQMLAPIALYPDALLSQMLMAASYPFEVVEADKFLAKNPGLNSDALDNALKEKDWDVSVLSLCYYPTVLSMMTENLNWTARLGDAFVNQQEEVMDTVQELRAKAYAEGNITTTPEQKVIVEERIIRIETVSPDYMYVPVYDPYVIYGPWWYPAYLPFPIYYPGVAVIGPRIVFSPRVYVGFGVFGWSAFNWHAHNVGFVNIDRTKRFNRNVNVYRGVEHSPWRPDRERRFVREQRAKEIPRYKPVVRTLAPVPARRPGDKTVAPPKSDQSRERKPLDRKIEPRDRNVGIQQPAQIPPVPERKPLDRKVEPRDRNVGVKPPAKIQPVPERKPLDKKIEPRDRNIGVKPPAQVQPQPEIKSVIEKDKVEKERGEGDRGNERGSSGGREGKR